MRDAKVNKAIFTQAPDPITCGGAPQKILYTTCDYWKKNNKTPSEISFLNASDKIFGVKFYSDKLQTIADGYGVNTQYGYTLEEVSYTRF